MHAPPEPSAQLAARQAELVAALVAGGPDPAGFDPDRLAVARRALVRKRAGEVAATWPLLAASLGPKWPTTFAAFVADRTPAGALRDGWDLARELHRIGDLADAAASPWPGAAARRPARPAATRRADRTRRQVTRPLHRDSGTHPGRLRTCSASTARSSPSRITTVALQQGVGA